MESLVATASVFFQPSQVKTALALGFSLGAAGSALKRKE